MKQIVFQALMVLLGWGSIPDSAIAQDKSAAKQGYLIWEDVVIPSEVTVYEDMTRQQLKLYASQNFPHRVDVFNTTDFTYYWVIEVDRYASIDTLYMDFNSIYRNQTEKVNEIMEGFAGTQEFTRSWTCYFDGELSFRPPGQDESENEGPYIHMGFCYPVKGKMEEARLAMKGFVSLSNEKGASLGWDTYVGDLGVDAPMFFWASFASDPVEFHQLNSSDFEMLGEKADELWNDLRNTLRKYEEKQGWYRKDLSYDPGS